MVKCPLCGWSGKQFTTFGGRENARCPNCKALERHRALIVVLRHVFEKIETPAVLHVAPERFLTRFLKDKSNYLSADISGKAMVKEDVRSLSFADNSFDMIVCVHVLEHVVEDITAMKELYRVLRDDGLAFLQVPMEYHKTETFEDSTIVKPQDRKKVFGQADHVHIYGLDYHDRLESVGFNVNLIFPEFLVDNAKDYAFPGYPIVCCSKKSFDIY